MLITWHKVKFSLVTHDVDGFTDNDFEMAAKINALEQ
jgi:pterin-4a-carbinolamine dehydratase